MKFSKHCIVALAAAFCLALTLGVAAADTTLYGPSGLALNPTADIAPVGMTQGTIYWFNQDNTSNGGLDVDWLTLNAVGGSKPNAEFNIGYCRLDNTAIVNEADGLTAGAKFRLAEESDKFPAVAAGISYFDAGGLYERTSVYACASKDLTLSAEGNLGIRGTAGIRWADAEYTAGGVRDSTTDLVPFVGLEAFVAPRLTLLLELESEHSFNMGRTNTPFSAVLRYRPTDNLIVHGGLINTGFDDRSSVGIALSYIWERTGWR